MLTVRTTTKARRMMTSSKEDKIWLSEMTTMTILLSDLVVQKKYAPRRRALVPAAEISLSISEEYE